MTEHATVIRYNKDLKEADEKIVELLERYQNVNLSDKSQWANTSFAFARQLNNMLQLARMITLGALLRDESRGAHYKPDFPERNDEQFLKTTKASFTRRCGRAEVRVRRSGYAVHQAAAAQVRRGEVTVLHRRLHPFGVRHLSKRGTRSVEVDEKFRLSVRRGIMKRRQRNE